MLTSTWKREWAHVRDREGGRCEKGERNFWWSSWRMFCTRHVFLIGLNSKLSVQRVVSSCQWERARKILVRWRASQLKSKRKTEKQGLITQIKIHSTCATEKSNTPYFAIILRQRSQIRTHINPLMEKLGTSALNYFCFSPLIIWILLSLLWSRIFCHVKNYVRNDHYDGLL